MKASQATRRWTAIIAAGAAVIGVSAAAGYWLGQSRGSGTKLEAREADDAVLYWYDPMVPDQHFDKPGKSPFMDMQLVPRYAGEPDAMASVRIDPGVAQNLGVRLAIVERRAASPSVTASGVIAFNDRDVAVVQARQRGFVARSHRLAIGDVVDAGDALVDLRLPDWTGALAEYLALKGGGDPGLVSAARQRLAALGLSEDTIRDAEAKGVPPQTFTISSPIGGALAALDARSGMTIEAGTPIATIKGLSPVWLVVSVPQGAAGGLRTGDRVRARTPAYPGETLEARIESILPSADSSSRAVEVRVALPNPGLRLRPGMTAEVELSGAEAAATLLAPSEAVIRTGKRAVVILSLDDGRFVPVEVTTGASFGDRTEILSGLAEGQTIVASGQFLIDSEANLTGVMARLRPTSVDNDRTEYSATGKVTAIDAAGITLSHSPVEKLNWPAMTMQFMWGGNKNEGGIKIGDDVRFSFRRDGKAYVITAITRAGAPQ
jgi:Cu(I)/Ag(I) efflux system membrane fusion protein